jgi:hypothetical protein
MIEEGLFARFLKPLLNKKNEKDGIQSVLDMYIKTPHTFLVHGLQVRIQKVSTIQRREIMLHKEKIEKDLENILSKRYTISF